MYDMMVRKAVTLSLGLGSFPQDGVTSAAMLKAADAALYRAKHAGCSPVALAH
jgi:GGDEF domain-containing protein